jgi:predicted DNA repair protein MutK
MPSGGLLALLDDISIFMDDVAAQAKVAAIKTAPVMGDDVAVNAKQVYGVAADRELPVIWEVTKGSFWNKVKLIPAFLAVSAAFPAAITPILMCGGAYLCYEGTEKVWHGIAHKKEKEEYKKDILKTAYEDPKKAEEQKIDKAVFTDFILSAEILAISLSTVAAAPFLTQLGTLTAMGVGATAGIYGLVAGFVRMDDAGFWLMKQKNKLSQAIGHGIAEYAAPGLSKALSVFGTAAMLTVGGGILMHGVAELLPSAGNLIHTAEHMVHSIPFGQSFVLPTLVGGIGGAIAIPAAKYGIIPAYNKVIKPCVDFVKNGLDKIMPNSKKNENENKVKPKPNKPSNENAVKPSSDNNVKASILDVDNNAIDTDIALKDDLEKAVANQNNNDDNKGDKPSDDKKLEPKVK